jgi:ubiquinone/menaquinone biosynthesis C-methylase UbiE
VAALIGSIVVLVLISLAWRLASRRHSIPCPAWLGWLVELDNPFARTNRAAAIVEHLDLSPGMTVLDLGCGPGRVAVPVAGSVGPQGRVIAMDIQARMISRAQEKAQEAGLTNIDFLHAGSGENQLGRERFDRVLLVTVLGEIPDRETALQEIFASLKAGGILSVTEIIFDPHFQSRNTVSRLALEVGFSEKEYFGSRLAYTLNLEKPESRLAADRKYCQ